MFFIFTTTRWRNA